MTSFPISKIKGALTPLDRATVFTYFTFINTKFRNVILKRKIFENLCIDFSWAKPSSNAKYFQHGQFTTGNQTSRYPIIKKE